jgi:hypothetical protein
LTHDGKKIEELKPGQTSGPLSETGLYEALAPFITLPEPPPPPIVLLTVTVSRLIGAQDKTFVTHRNSGNFSVAIEYEGVIEA